MSSVVKLSVVLLPFTTHYPLPSQSGFLEVEEPGHFKAGDIQVAKHLGNVRVIERTGHFRVGNDFTIHNQVRHELANEVSVVVHRILTLLFHRVPARHEFDDQGVLVKLLVQPGLKLVQHRHRRADNVLGNFFVLHGFILTTNVLTTDCTD